MKTLLKQVVSITGLMLLCSSASALCVDTGVAALGKNEVGIAPATCTTISPTAASCDMNGLQERLPTHGQWTVTASATGAFDYWVSWTRNGPETTEEYSCFLGPNLVGPGWVHIFSGQAGVAKGYQAFDECKLTLADC